MPKAMFRVLSCLTGEHDWRLVLLAGLVCFAASIVAVSIFHRAIASQTRTRLVWIAIAGASIGYGIWATHFIAMLAYEPGVSTGYGVVLTALSLAAAMLLTSTGFGYAANNPGRWRAPIGGGIVGAGIASMHYLGMWALEVPGRVTWSFDLVFASIALGMFFGYAALVIAVRHNDKWGTFLAAFFLTLAIVSHHFTAMGAVEVIPDPTRAPDALSLSPPYLALAIAGVALSVLGMSLVGVLADRRLANRTRNFEEIISELSYAQQQVEGSKKELQEQKLRLDTAINHMAEGLCMFDAEKRLVVCNDRYSKMYKLPPELLRAGTPHREIIEHRITSGILKGETSDSAAKRLISTLSALPSDTTSSRIDELADGRLICVTRQPMAGGGWVATHLDVTERQRFEAKITYLAHHDALTGLASRSFFTETMEAAKTALEEHGRPFAILMLDLDRFKRINDTLGHFAGNSLLKDVARRLRSVATKGDLVARLGGDEFAIIQFTSSACLSNECKSQHHDSAAVLATDILNVINEPFLIDGHTVFAGTSVGIVLAPGDGIEPNDLLKKADIALYKSKSKGRNVYSFFDPDMMSETSELHKLETDMRLGLEQSHFEVYYQPFVNARTKTISGAEALLRWHHPELGMISPARFIPLAESTGLIIPLGEFVLKQACLDAMRWPASMKVAVNLSAVQFRKANLFDAIMCALVDSGLPPERLEVEVTESVLLENDAEYVTLLHQLKNIGVTVALDDFGTGYSSLSYLKQFPFDKIKIDRSFVNDIGNDQGSMAIVSAIIGLSRGLDMITTVEGIETEEQFEIMRAAGVTLAQGYLFGRPCPISELTLVRDAVAMQKAG